MHMEKRIALPVEDGILCAHFGHCKAFAIVTVVDNEITETKELTPPEHAPGSYPRWIASLGVTDVIAGGMGQKAIQLFQKNNINVFVGAPVETPETLVRDFLADKLELTANYCNHDTESHRKHRNRCDRRRQRNRS
jgi:predicted Fe-Mo cluster-binding NifX family protein